MRALMLLVTLTLALPRVALAQALPDEVSLEEVVAYVRQESPASRALRGQIAVADADIDLAGVYPNPELSYVGMGRFDGGNAAINGSQHQVWLDIPLLVAGQNGARREVAEADAQTMRAEVDAQLLLLEIEVRRAFLALLAAQDRSTRLEASRAALLRVQSLVEGRASAGAQSRYDGVRIAVELARLDSELAVERIAIRQASAALARLAGRPGWQPSARGNLDAADAQYSRAEDSPLVRAARARLAAAERDVHRAEVERIPEITLGAGAYFTTDLDSSSAYLGLTIPLPVIDTGEAAVRRAEAAREAAREASEATERQAIAHVEGALLQLRLQREALAQFEASAMARLPELAEMAETEYRLGESGIFALLDALRTRAELELARVELLRAALEAEINVREAGARARGSSDAR